jgi:hypothetical protein
MTRVSGSRNERLHKHEVCAWQLERPSSDAMSPPQAAALMKEGDPMQWYLAGLALIIGVIIVYEYRFQRPDAIVLYETKGGLASAPGRSTRGISAFPSGVRLTSAAGLTQQPWVSRSASDLWEPSHLPSGTWRRSSSGVAGRRESPKPRRTAGDASRFLEGIHRAARDKQPIFPEHSRLC